MTTIKSFTDIPQSKKLSEILPLESADMRYEYSPIEREDIQEPIIGFSISSMNYYKDSDLIEYLPCWSLAALLGVLPPIEGFCPIIDLDINLIRYEGNYRDELCFNGDNLIDACYEMILKLHELNLL